MSFGNSSNIDTSSYSLDGGFGGYGDTGFENLPVEGFSTDKNGYEILPSWTTEGISADDNSIGRWINTLGRLGSGVLGGLADYQSSQQPSYMLKTNWLGNGLAATGLINNLENKQQQQNNAYGNALMLSSLFGRGFGRKNDTIDPLPKGGIWD